MVITKPLRGHWLLLYTLSPQAKSVNTITCTGSTCPPTYKHAVVLKVICGFKLVLVLSN